MQACTLCGGSGCPRATCRMPAGPSGWLQIRNKQLSKRDTEKLVKEIWKARMSDSGEHPGSPASPFCPTTHSNTHMHTHAQHTRMHISCMPPSSRRAATASPPPPGRSRQRRAGGRAGGLPWHIPPEESRNPVGGRRGAHGTPTAPLRPCINRCSALHATAATTALLAAGWRPRPPPALAGPPFSLSQLAYNFLYSLWKYQWDADCELFMKVLQVSPAGIFFLSLSDGLQTYYMLCSLEWRRQALPPAQSKPWLAWWTQHSSPPLPPSLKNEVLASLYAPSAPLAARPTEEEGLQRNTCVTAGGGQGGRICGPGQAAGGNGGAVRGT
jgi:hypothetical protein